MRSQIVSMAFVTTVVFFVAAGGPFIQETLGRRAAKLSSLTGLIYIFFSIGSMRLLPASGLRSPPFAPARHAHPPTGPVVPVSLALVTLSLQMLHAAVAAVARWRPALSSIFLPRAFERCRQRFWVEKFGACGGQRAIVGSRCI